MVLDIIVHNRYVYNVIHVNVHTKNRILKIEILTNGFSLKILTA